MWFHALNSIDLFTNSFSLVLVRFTNYYFPYNCGFMLWNILLNGLKKKDFTWTDMFTILFLIFNRSVYSTLYLTDLFIVLFFTWIDLFTILFYILIDQFKILFYTLNSPIHKIGFIFWKFCLQIYFTFIWFGVSTVTASFWACQLTANRNKVLTAKFFQIYFHSMLSHRKKNPVC